MFLGVDIGTTGIKTCLVDLEGRVVGNYRKLKTHGLEENRRELCLYEIFIAVKDTIGEVTANGQKQVEAITVSSLGEAIVPVDHSGNP